MLYKQIYRVLFLVTLSIAVSHAVAGNITPEAARGIATHFVKQHNALGFKATSMTDLQLVHAEASKTVKNASDYYAFNIKGGGFIIIAGEDRATQVLGYSDKGRLDFNNLPCGLKTLLDCYKQDIEFLQTCKDSDLMPAPNLNRDSTGVEPLLKTTWGQGPPYNWQCPMSEGELCIVGCAATAMAQVMNYWQFPESSDSIASYYCSAIGQDIPALPPTTFDYSLILNSYCHRDLESYELIQDIYTDAQVQEVAKLSRYCGQAVQMGYTPQGSSAYVDDMLEAMIAFGFTSAEYQAKPATWFIFDYTEEWEARLRTELDAGRPIIYCARDIFVDTGHGFICDGYNSEGKFHFNFGWYGVCDGWYVSTALDLIPREGVERYYNYSHEIIAGIVPPVPVSTVTGDVNNDGEVNISDVTLYINYLLNDDATDFLIANADFNEDGEANISDVIDMINYLLNNV